MDRPMSNLHFKVMSFEFKFRDLFLPPRKKLNDVGIRPGFHILDYGCGPGSYSIAAAELVGNSGKVRAEDEILSEITKTNLFALSRKGKMSYLFLKG